MELYGYNTDLRSMTGGRGDYSYEFARYEKAPADVQQKEVEERAGKAETMESPATTRSLDDVWPFVIDYHHNHTHVTDVGIRKQYEFLHTISTKLNRAPRTESSKYIVFYPSKAGLGNTLAAWSEALLLTMYSQRFFKRSSFRF